MKFVSYDSKLVYVMNKIVDIVIADLLWLLCSIPLVTLGASTAALYYTTVKVIRRDRSKVTKEFFASFKINLKYGTLATLFFAAVGFLLYLYTWFYEAMDANTFAGMMYFFSMVSAIVLFSITMSFFFPILSRFQMKFWKLLRLSFFVAIRNIGRAILSALLIAIGAVLGRLNVGFLLLLPALISLIVSFFIEPVLQKYMPRDAVGVDDWYFEDKNDNNNDTDDSQ